MVRRLQIHICWWICLYAHVHFIDTYTSMHTWTQKKLPNFIWWTCLIIYLFICVCCIFLQALVSMIVYSYVEERGGCQGPDSIIPLLIKYNLYRLIFPKEILIILKIKYLCYVHTSLPHSFSIYTILQRTVFRSFGLLGMYTSGDFP